LKKVFENLLCAEALFVRCKRAAAGEAKMYEVDQSACNIQRH